MPMVQWAVYLRGRALCTAEKMCPDPVITKVYPLSAHINAVTPITVEGFNLGYINKTLNAVSVGNISCYTNHTAADVINISTRIKCWLRPSHRVATENITLTIPGHNSVVYDKHSFNFQFPRLTRIFPNYGPLSGGTNVTIDGEHLDTGWERKIKIGEQLVTVQALQLRFQVVRVVIVSMVFDNEAVKGVNFTYVPDPKIWDIQPRKSFESGGRFLTVTGLNLLSVQTPKLRAHTIDGKTSVEIPCRRGKAHDLADSQFNGNLACRSPMLISRGSSKAAKLSHEVSGTMEISFVMDDVESVRNLPSNISVLLYYTDPTLYNFTETLRNTQGIIIKGEHLDMAATAEDVQVLIDCEKCNVTTLEHDRIFCTPPTIAPKCNVERQTLFPIKVRIGFLKGEVGQIEYALSESKYPHLEIIGLVVVIVCVFFGVLCLACFIRVRLRIKHERKDNEYKLDEMEGRYRNQCREEFAALQTAMVDLTSELEGGNVLFREFDDFACKTLLSAEGSLGLMSPPLLITSSIENEMEQFKRLLKSHQFLLTFIRALEKQNSFSIHDRSDVATYLMVINHDNMEFITSILTDLLDALIDKNVAAKTPKLLLRRSESIAEKLLTHWLSVCLYHYLKEHTGSVLFILYQAIKMQVEKGPVDYITSCAKYTLSEDKLFTGTDQTKSLALEVYHLHNIENQQKTINVVVLDCDTITQAKGKMLEILYKNTGYSQRPSAHATVLEVEESGGTRRTLLDEDASSVKNGIWKKINTLQHYNVPDGAKMYLGLNRQYLTMSFNIKTASSSESFGNIRQSKPIVRTDSGSNVWHLMKQHEEDEEVKLASDFFLPRLLLTKGTLQEYIDDFYSKILDVQNDPPIIIKFLFDMLDSAANRCNITDPDVIHTWKCNSLLLRFWVNIIKNPEFAFDIHKPVIVDSCLSVIAQTLMDSCSTAESRLGPGSPSNKLLFAKDIPRYKKMVKEYFAEIKSRRAVSDQELNSYLTQKISQKYSGKVYQSTALLEMFKFAKRYREKISVEMDNEEAEHPGTVSTLSCKLQCIHMAMDQLQQ
ncbi:plexin-A1-like isoform X2 [Mya arenaria]|uniref:plexin-A1-like isoform X2 n=1 Tax=Mya arenaria TaxID=6604 RepID=UPI0022E44A77|nr:plexin-A1-like isoform X2 [Mya arenaria]